jgi:hypothetical protein
MAFLRIAFVSTSTFGGSGGSWLKGFSGSNAIANLHQKIVGHIKHLLKS